MSSTARARAWVALWVVLGASAAGTVRAAESAGGDDRPVRLEVLVVRDRIEANGVHVRWQQNTAVLLTPAGVAHYSQVGVPFFEANQTAKIESLRVAKADGRELDLLASAPTDVAPLLPPNLPIYSDLRMLRAAVPSLEVGDRITFASSVRVEPLTANQVWTDMTFADVEDVRVQVYELDVPDGSSLVVHARTDDDIRFEEERREGRWIRRWRRERPASDAGEARAGDSIGSERDRHEEAEPATEATAAEDEQEDLATADIVVSSYRSWDELGRWWSSLAPNASDAAVAVKAAELTAGAATPVERLRAIHRYVAQEIRYLALPLGLGRFRSRPPEEVIRTGFGDCKDKARLLASLAGAVGIEVDDVLLRVGTKAKLVEEVASPGQFDHVVSRARIGDDEIWMDATSEMTPMGRLPSGERGLRGVAVHAKSAQAEVVETPEPGGWTPTIRTETTAAIDASGAVRAKVRWTYDTDAESYRLIFRYGNDRQRREAVEAIAYEWGDEAKLTTFRNAEPRELDTPFWIEYEIEKELEPTVWRKAWSYWPPTIRLYLKEPPDAADDAKRRAAGGKPSRHVDLGFVGREIVSARFEFPEGVVLAPPVPVSLRGEFADYRSDYRVEGRTLIVERELVTRAERVPRERFAELRSFRDSMKKDRNQEADVAAAPQLVPEGAESADELADLCDEAYDAGRDAEAETLCRRAVALDPEHRWAWNGLGRTLSRMGRGDEAKEALRRQIEVHPGSHAAYTNLGHVYWRERDYVTAEKYLRQQIEVAPLSASAHRSLGRLLRIVKRYDEAESMLRRAMKLEPDDDDAVEDLILLEAQRGRFAEAGELIRDNPDLPRDSVDRRRVVAALVAAGKGPWSPFAGLIERTRAEADERLAAFSGAPTAEVLGDIWNLIVLWEAQARVELEAGRAAEAAILLEASSALGSERAGRVLDGMARTGHASLRTAKPTDIQVSALTTRKLPAAAGTQGELWLVFSPEGKVVAANPVEADGPKALAASLVQNPLTLPLPRGNRARLPLKLLAHCAASGVCTLTLEPPGQSAGELHERERGAGGH
jgi:Flp pilus assembly protein TadD/transglutaminase-like putative cysteine protease